jgi:hypothetical protein
MSNSSIVLVQTGPEVNVTRLIEDILVVAESEKLETSLILGPTDPLDCHRFEGRQIGWLTWEENDLQKGRPSLVILKPSDLVGLRLYISDIISQEHGRLAVIGDFLDTIFTSVPSNETLFILISQIATRMKSHNVAGIFIVSEGLHDETRLAIVRRFADSVVRIKPANEPTKSRQSSRHRAAPESLYQAHSDKGLFLP